MGQIGAILFPHASLPEKVMKKGLSFFSPLTVCQPWYMDRPLPLAKEGLIQSLRPPAEFKPPPDFSKLLAEYRTWIRTTHGKGVDAYTAFSRERLIPREAPWDIRRSLRSPGNADATSLQERIFKWNLMLHLGQEMEDAGSETDRLIDELRSRESPLGDLVQDEVDSVHSVVNLVPFGKEFSRDGMDHVIEAWVSLFEGQLEGHDVALTFSRTVFDRLSERWEEEGGAPHPAAMECLVPDFSDHEPDELAELKSRFLASREGADIGNSIMRCGRAVSAKSQNHTSSERSHPYPKVMKMFLRCFEGVQAASGPMGRFSGKTVCFIEEGSSHHQ